MQALRGFESLPFRHVKVAESLPMLLEHWEALFLPDIGVALRCLKRFYTEDVLGGQVQGRPFFQGANQKLLQTNRLISLQTSALILLRAF